MASGSDWTINSRAALSTFLREIQEAWARHPYLRITVRSGEQRSLSQNALWAIWARDYIAPFAGLSEEGARMAMRHMFLGYEDVKVSDKLTIRGQLKSTSDLEWQDMHQFMTDVQAFWANRGLFLESKGEFLDRQREQVA